MVEMEIGEIIDKGNVLIKVYYSALNYKDALSCSGNKGVTRKYPHTPGIDAAGVVEVSEVPYFEVGDKVIVTGDELGMNHHGGLSEYICVPAKWIVPLPENMSLKDSMMYGTAGLTAAQCISKIINGGQIPEMGPLVITGAAGGVGSIACLIFKKLGYEVWAATSNLEDSKE